MLRADRAGGDTKTPRSRRALQLAQIAVEALRAWQADQTAEREAAGSRWQDTGRVFTTATGAPLGARQVRKMFQDVCERAGFGRGLGAAGPAAHVRLAAVRRRHGDREDRPAGRPSQQPCHRDRVRAGAWAGPAGRRQGDGPGSSETSGSITDNARELGPALLPAIWRQPRRDRHRRRAVFDQ